MVSKIPFDSIRSIDLQADSETPKILTIFYTSMISFLVLTLLCVYFTHRKTVKVREEVLSLDSVTNLYALLKFKPYFNEIYYS